MPKAKKQLEFIRLGLRNRKVSTKLRLRWDRAPKACAATVPLLPVEGQVYHGKYACNEIYVLLPMVKNPPPLEWNCLYPGPGDLVFAPLGADHSAHLIANLQSGSVPKMDTRRGLLDLAFFYERGNSLIGPYGVDTCSIIATGTSFEELEVIAAACRDLWFSGAKGESMYIEPA
jgi:hypothetical protein